MPQLNSRVLPFALFLALTSALVGVAVGLSRGGWAVGTGAGALTCLVLTASTFLAVLLTQSEGSRKLDQFGRVFLALNLVALATSVGLAIATGGSAQKIGVAASIVAVVMLLGLESLRRRV